MFWEQEGDTSEPQLNVLTVFSLLTGVLETT